MIPTIQGIDHLHLFVADRAAAQRWYAEVLGFEPVAELAHWAAGGGPLTLADAGGTVHLALFERPPQPCRSTIAFGVTAAQFAAWQKHLAACLPQPPQGVDHGAAWSLYFSDPDGNPYEITTYEHAQIRAAPQ
jgi:catechol 2,3-dioxygenase-like lactoylglutathione lyase family enzyme